MADPLILSPQAARRLRLLLSHGAQLPLPTVAAPPAHVAAAATPSHDVTLPAALLAEPVLDLAAVTPAHGTMRAAERDGGRASTHGHASWLRERDVLAEVAVTPRTLQRLQARPRRKLVVCAHCNPLAAGADRRSSAVRMQLPSGAMVLLTTGQPTTVPHLARLLALPDMPPSASCPSAAPVHEDNVAYLAPSLAYNLGLGLHLRPLLLGNHLATEENASGASDSSRASAHCVTLQRLAGPPRQGSPASCRELVQPGCGAACIPVATEVELAVVRAPMAALLQWPHGKSLQEDGGAGPDTQTAADGRERARGAEPAGAHIGSNGLRRQAPTGHRGTSAADDATKALQRWLLAGCRIVQQGDVLAVTRLSPTSTEGAELPQVLPNLHAAQPRLAQLAGAAGTAPPVELMYFKVTKLVTAQQRTAGSGMPCCAAAAIDVGSTSVKLVGSCRGGIPVGLPHYLGGRRCSSDVLGAHVAALSAPNPTLPSTGMLLPAWRRLAELLASVLHPAAAGMSLRLAVLLHGPASSGKQTGAAAAAAAVGCHLVSLSCYDIRAGAGAAERHTFDGLRAAFAAAADYAPSVLHLRDLEVLGDGSSHSGSGSASAQSYVARLGRVLDECVHSHAADGGSTANSPFPAPVVLIASTTLAEDLPPALRRCFTHELEFQAPDQHQRQQLLLDNLAGLPAACDWLPRSALAPGTHEAGGSRKPKIAGSDGLVDAARHTAGLLPRELRAVVADAAASAALHTLPATAVLQAACITQEDSCSGSCSTAASASTSVQMSPALSQEHVAAAIEAVRQRTAADIGAEAAEHHVVQPRCCIGKPCC